LFRFFDPADLVGALGGCGLRGGGGVAFGVPGEIAVFLPAADGCVGQSVRIFEGVVATVVVVVFGGGSV